MKKIIVIKLRAMGDTVLMTATLSELRRLVPECEIDVVVPKAWGDLLIGNWAVRRLFSFDTRLKGPVRLVQLFSLGIKLRLQSYDAAFVLHASSGTSLLALLSGAPKRFVHNHNFNEANLYGTAAIPEKEILKPFIKRDLATLQAAGLTPNLEAKARLYLTQADRKFADTYFLNHSLRKPLLCLGLGASRETKIWPMTYFAEIASKWHGTTGGSVLCVGSSNEASLFSELKSHVLGDISWLEGEFSLELRHLMAVVSTAKNFLGNDSGPRHVAAALGVRTLTLYGPQDPYECHPYDLAEHPYFFIEGLDCRTEVDPSGQHRWCGISRCVERKHECMVGLKSDQVWEKLVQSH